MKIKFLWLTLLPIFCFGQDLKRNEILRGTKTINTKDSISGLVLKTFVISKQERILSFTRRTRIIKTTDIVLKDSVQILKRISKFRNWGDASDVIYFNRILIIDNKILIFILSRLGQGIIKEYNKTGDFIKSHKINRDELIMRYSKFSKV